MARLIISSPDGKRGILELTRPVITIGRGNANDLVLNDNSVSRFHAVIKEMDGEYVVADRGSTNGVVIAGQRVTGERKLHNGERLKIGAYEVRFESMESAKLVVTSPTFDSTLRDVLKGHHEVGHPSDIAADTAGVAGTDAPQLNPPRLMDQFWKLEHENYLLRLLYDAGRALNAKLSIEDIAEQVMSLAFRIAGVERGFMMLMDEKGEITTQTEVRYRRPPTKDQPQIILSRAMLERMKDKKEPVLITDATEDERFLGSESMKVAGLRSAMCAPLVGTAGHLAGILYVDNMDKPAAFTQEEMNIFAVIASQAAAAIDNAAAHRMLAEQALQQRALERFLSPEVVEMIAVNPEGIRLGGVNQKVSILFADIRGFTTMSETMAPQKVVEILNEYFTRFTDVIFDHGGTLDKYLGDGIMAVFGAPISKGNDAASAVQTAVAIQKLVQELNHDATARGWPRLRVGVGVNTGVVTAGNIGSPRRLDYTVIGDAVNVAARLMANATGGQVLITQTTAAELGDTQFKLRQLDPLTVKGRAEPLVVFGVEWAAKKELGVGSE